jgi:hypothetical protein
MQRAAIAAAVLAIFAVGALAQSAWRAERVRGAVTRRRRSGDTAR